MENLLRAIGLEAHYQQFRAMFPEYISRGDFFCELRTALRNVMHKRASASELGGDGKDRLFGP